MAALYLHHALFSDDYLPAPSVTRTSHDRYTSSLSSATLRATLDYSHPTEPLLQQDESNVASVAYADLLSQQPGHPSELSVVPNCGLSLQSDTVTSRERARLLEQASRRKLRYSRRWVGTSLCIIGVWSTYSAIRYFIALSLYPAQSRLHAAVALGIISVLSLALAVISASFHLLPTRALLRRAHSSLDSRAGAILDSLVAILLLIPAITNLVLVQRWRKRSDLSLALEGRCAWDVDVVWSKPASSCQSQHGIAWGYWLAGAILRLVITLIVLVGYGRISYQHNALMARPSRPKGGRTHTHSVSHPSGSETNPSVSVRSTYSCRTMVSSLTQPASLAYSVRQPSFSTSDKESLSEGSSSANAPERRHLPRASSGRPSLEPLRSEERQDGRASSYSQTSSEGTIRASRVAVDEEEVPSDAPDNLANFNLVDDHHLPGPPLHGPSVGDFDGSEQIVWRSGHGPPEDDLRNFVDQFRQLMEEVTQETEAGIELAGNDQPGYYTDGTTLSPSADSQATSEEVDYVPIVGSMIRRMPTIESFGSREVMSLASSSVHRHGDRSLRTLSRPSTRANTLSMSDTGSHPPSRSSSLTASVALSSPSDVPSPNDLGSPLSLAPRRQ